MTAGCFIGSLAARETARRKATKGWLDLVVLHLASIRNFQNLLDLNAQRANERKALA